ncbi:MAG TPA: DNA repair protein RadC, partial [Chthonomonadales bacterium]|nr:DNA repair protein RadC [Chthonomonadales bacterium]
MKEKTAVMMREVPDDERPRERLLTLGPQVLSNVELLALQLCTGAAGKSAIGLAELLLSELDGLRGVARGDVGELMKVKGIGIAKACKILAALELGKRLAALNPEEKRHVVSADEAAKLLYAELREASKEVFKALLLDTKHHLIKIVTVSIGTLDSSLVSPRELFRDAVKASASAVIVAHNHPSGDPTPSAQDKLVTARLTEAGKLMGIEVLDHVIIGENRFVS